MSDEIKLKTCTLSLSPCSPLPFVTLYRPMIAWLRRSASHLVLPVRPLGLTDARGIYRSPKARMLGRTTSPGNRHPHCFRLLRCIALDERKIGTRCSENL